MINKPDFNLIGNISEEDLQKNLEEIVEILFNNIKDYLDLEPCIKNFKIQIIKSKYIKDEEEEGIFNIGVDRSTQNDILIILIYEEYTKFLPFILLREIYNLFIPIELKHYESVQLVINQILMSDLSKQKIINQWRSLIRENLEQNDSLSLGFDRLSDFDRLDYFFKIQESRKSYTATQFFFKYLRERASLIKDRSEDIHNLFYDEFWEYILKSMINDELTETIRCLIDIFYNVKHYRNLLSYKRYFQEFKEKGKLLTDLSLRKFIKNMDWVKNESYIAPSYQINRKTFNVHVLIVFMKFNPILNKSKIYKIMEHFPFFTTVKIASNTFALELSGFIIIPNIYFEDFKRFIKRLKHNGFIIKILYLNYNFHSYSLNLNYFRTYSQKQRLLNPNHRQYDKKYEIGFNMNYGDNLYQTDLSPLDFLILDRIQNFSASGLGFERREETLHILKSDLLNTIITHRSIIKNLKNTLKLFHSSIALKNELLQLIEENKNFGFFSIKSILEDILKIMNILNNKYSNYLEKSNFSQLQDLINNRKISNLIEENNLLKNKSIKKFVYKELIPLFMKSKRKIYEIREKFRKFYEIFNSCYNLKLFDLNAIQEIVKDECLVDTIYEKKDEKFKKIYKKYKLYKITSQEIDEIFERFLNHQPPIIQPNLINTIDTSIFRKDFFELLLDDSEENRKFLEELIIFFPKVLIVHSKDIISNKKILYIEFFIPDLIIKEKKDLYSTFYNYFNKNIIFGKNYIWSGYTTALSSKNFYDFGINQFFYTKDLFEQFFLYVQNVFGKQFDVLQEKGYKQKEKFWAHERNLLNLVKKANIRISRENKDFTITPLNKLLDFHLRLEKSLLDTKEFSGIKREYYFKNYIKSIKFIPAFQRLGFGQYFFYLYSTDMNKLDFKLLLMNTFQKVKFDACIDDSNSLFINYVMPYNKPNLKYLNWLTKSKKVIREYCVFFIKKVYQICHFNYNLSLEGWEYDKNRFKKYMQNILFNPNYNIQIPKIKEFNLSSKPVSSYFGPESPEYKSLTQIYNWKSIDIKSYLATTKYSIVNHITSLMKQNLIFPYLSLKNLDLHNKIHIILPNVKPDLNKTLIKIFSFFNYGFVYEIEGEYFIYGFPEEVKFENGLMIKLYLPKFELHEFMRLFDLLFEYLEIKDYLILNDLIDGYQLVKSIYGSLDFLKEYNPLKNLIWNSKDKQWMNHKLFTQKFEPIYPDLLPKEES